MSVSAAGREVLESQSNRCIAPLPHYVKTSLSQQNSRGAEEQNRFINHVTSPFTTSVQVLSQPFNRTTQKTKQGKKLTKTNNQPTKQPNQTKQIKTKPNQTKPNQIAQKDRLNNPPTGNARKQATIRPTNRLRKQRQKMNLTTSSTTLPAWATTTITTISTTITTTTTTASRQSPLPPQTPWPDPGPIGQDSPWQGVELAWWAWLVAEVGVATVIVAGDLSLLMLFFTRKLLGQSTNILVFSVAVGDLMTGLMVLPLDVLQVRECFLLSLASSPQSWSLSSSSPSLSS